MKDLIKEVALVDRFMDRVEMIPISGCWLWTGSFVGRGYGTFYYSRSHKVRAHRLSYEIFKGSIPDGMCVCHRCDQPACVNPEHLFLGTHKENMDDMNSKGRNKAKSTPEVVARGERHWITKFSEDIVAKIKAEYVRSGYRKSNVKQLAQKYGVCRSTIVNIVSGRTWGHSNG